MPLERRNSHKAEGRSRIHGSEVGQYVDLIGRYRQP